jgi:hypothetical protein
LGSVITTKNPTQSIPRQRADSLSLLFYNPEFKQSAKKLIMLNVVTAVTGEVHSDHAIESIDRGTAKIDLLIGETQPLELIEDQLHLFGLDLWLSPFITQVWKTLQETSVKHLLLNIDFIIVGVIIKPAGQL